MMSTETTNFLIVFAPASLINQVLWKISFLRKSSDTIATSISLSADARPFACEPKRMIFEIAIPFFLSSFARKSTTFTICLLAILPAPCFVRPDPPTLPVSVNFPHLLQFIRVARRNADIIHRREKFGEVFSIDNFAKAQELSDSIKVSDLHRALDSFARKYGPVFQEYGLTYHWSTMQVEYATDIVFKRQSDLRTLYDQIVRTAIHSVKPENIATFLGRKLHCNYQGDMGNNFNTRIQGTRIKHHMDASSIKMYDKFGSILRIETTTNDVSEFKHYREVQSRNGDSVHKNAPMKKNIYSLFDLTAIFKASNPLS
jgi:hypothetical protein